MGISNPKNVQVYGYGGWMLDEDFTKPYIDDLPQVAVWMSKPRAEFGTGDYILFYARGDIKWTYDSAKNEFVHTQHPYSQESFYFVTEAEAGPLLMTESPSAAAPSASVSVFTDYYLHEKELVNVAKTGREFYGEDFLTAPSQDFVLTLQGAVSEPAFLRVNFIAKLSNASLPSYLNVKYGNSPMKAFLLPYSQSTLSDELNDTVYINNFTGSGTLNLHATGSLSKYVYLNYLKLEYARQLKPYGGVTLFRSKVQSDKLEYVISEATDKMLVFDVTDNITPKRINAGLSGTELRFTASNTPIREYALVDTEASDIPSPAVIGQVPNQNLHALEPKEMLIIVSPALKQYAEQLAQIHYNDSGMESLVLTSEEIYNEFSSGKPDITAFRRFVKMFFDRNINTMPQYLLLFGDGAYDNRFVEKAWNQSLKKVMLPTYQTIISLIEDTSLVTDDYIGFLDDNEAGTISLSNSTLDIGIGRLPVRNETEAQIVVTKIKNYIENRDKGLWKNNTAFYADDAIAGSTSSERFHCTQADEVAEALRANYPEFIVNKIYQDNYKRINTGSGVRVPDATEALLNKLNSGQLLLNFVGHGSKRDWTHEYVLTFQDIQNLRNKHLPLWITATCGFSRYDEYVTSGGEAVLLNPNGGGIALISTTRMVFSAFNAMLNKSVLNHTFEKKDNKPLRLGDILRKAKIDLGGQQNKLKFTLLGDPALRLSYPGSDYCVKVSTVNGLDTADNNIKIKAAANNKIKGIIADANGLAATEFNGTIEALIFDNEQNMKTLGQKLPSDTNDMSVTYKDYPNTIFSGSAPVVNGEFEINFVTPLDILYSNGYGKMSFYAYDDTGKEAQGSFRNYTVGERISGTEESVPPVIRQLYLNSADFLSGDTVNMTPVLYADIYDDTGFNLSSAIGHNISLTIDRQKSYNLTSCYQSKESAEDETGVAGTISYSIPDLTEGKHTLQFKVWDVFNNSVSKTLDFECVAEKKQETFKFDILNNPATTSADFAFHTNLSGVNLSVKYEVYSSDGDLQWSHEITGLSESLNGQSYQWNLSTAGGKLQPGMYICRANISMNGNAIASKSEKLVVLGQ
jgi:hypothetical protein